MHIPQAGVLPGQATLIEAEVFPGKKRSEKCVHQFHDLGMQWWFATTTLLCTTTCRLDVSLIKSCPPPAALLMTLLLCHRCNRPRSRQPLLVPSQQPAGIPHRPPSTQPTLHISVKATVFSTTQVSSGGSQVRSPCWPEWRWSVVHRQLHVYWQCRVPTYGLINWNFLSHKIL